MRRGQCAQGMVTATIITTTYTDSRQVTPESGIGSFNRSRDGSISGKSSQTSGRQQLREDSQLIRNRDLLEELRNISRHPRASMVTKHGFVNVRVFTLATKTARRVIKYIAPNAGGDIDANKSTSPPRDRLPACPTSDSLRGTMAFNPTQGPGRRTLQNQGQFSFTFSCCP